MIPFISDFDLRGSGYMNIAIALCRELSERGHEIKALGIGYSGNEHSWPFSIFPVNARNTFTHVPAIIQNMRAIAGTGQLSQIEAIVCALDIPMQERFLRSEQFKGIPYVGIFPIESGPLCQSWANVLAMMDRPLVISKFGLKQMENAGVDGDYIPIGLDTESWRRPTAKEKNKLREAMGYTDDQLVVLTVADNQERKNLSAAMDTIKHTADSGIDVQWMLVTRVNSQVGWKLDDMAIEKGVMDRFVKFERGLPFDRLWMLYACADVFLLTSKAEGLCMPLIEAMATGVVVVATDCTAVTEHLFENPEDRTGYQRGFPIKPVFLHQDPWGNSIRSYIDGAEAAKTLAWVNEMKKAGTLEADILTPARAYAESRTWEHCGDVLDQVVSEVLKPPEPQVATLEGGLTPSTVPRIIPISEEDIDEQAEFETEEEIEAETETKTEPIAGETASGEDST